MRQMRFRKAVAVLSPIALTAASVLALWFFDPPPWVVFVGVPVLLVAFTLTLGLGLAWVEVTHPLDARLKRSGFVKCFRGHRREGDVDAPVTVDELHPHASRTFRNEVWQRGEGDDAEWVCHDTVWYDRSAEGVSSIVWMDASSGSLDGTRPVSVAGEMKGATDERIDVAVAGLLGEEADGDGAASAALGAPEDGTVTSARQRAREREEAERAESQRAAPILLLVFTPGLVWLTVEYLLPFVSLRVAVAVWVAGVVAGVVVVVAEITWERSSGFIAVLVVSSIPMMALVPWSREGVVVFVLAMSLSVVATSAMRRRTVRRAND